MAEPGSNLELISLHPPTVPKIPDEYAGVVPELWGSPTVALSVLLLFFPPTLKHRKSLNYLTLLSLVPNFALFDKSELIKLSNTIHKMRF